MILLNEHEKFTAALARATSQKCGYWYEPPCDKPRADGDHVCAEHRRALNARWKEVRERAAP